MPRFPWDPPKPEEQFAFSRPRFKTQSVHPNTSFKPTELYASPPDRVEPRAGKGTSAEKAPDPDLGQDLIPVERYITPDFMRLEWDRLWTRVWLMACRETDIAQPGDYVTFSLGNESIIIVRQWDDSIRAFFNVCRHRGNRLVAGDGTHNPDHASSFLCPYHHWEWAVDGTLKDVPDPETFAQGVPCEHLGLNQIRCEPWGGWVFITLNPHAEELSEYLELLPEQLDPYRWENLVHTLDKTVEWNCNWKTAMDAFSETYNVKALHPQLLGWTEDYHVQIDTYGRHSRSLIPFQIASSRHPDQNVLSPDVAAQLTAFGIFAKDFEGRPGAARRALQKARREVQERATHLPYRHLNDEQLTDNYQYTIFPNISVNIFADYTLMQRMRPHESDPDKCYCDVQILTYQDPQRPRMRAPHEVLEPGTTGLGPVIDQKAAILPDVQKGMHSASFQGLYLSEQERRIRHFHRVLMAYLGEIEEPAPNAWEDEPAPAPQPADPMPQRADIPRADPSRDDPEDDLIPVPLPPGI